MKIEKPVALIYFSLCGLILAGILWSSPRADKSNTDDADAQAALAAFGGGNVDMPSDESGENSFFADPDFMEAATGDGSIDEDAFSSSNNKNTEEPEILEPVSKDNPINPQTGQRYTDAAMKRFAALRKRFPNNTLIPRRKTPQEKQAEKERQNRMFALQSLVVQGNANPKEINDYYDMQIKSYKDRKELLDYVFETMGEKMSDDVKEQYKKIKEMNKRQIRQIEEQRKNALSRASGG